MEGGEWLYIYFSPDLLRDQLRRKHARFEKQKQNKLAKKARKRGAVERLPFE